MAEAKTPKGGADKGAKTKGAEKGADKKAENLLAQIETSKSKRRPGCISSMKSMACQMLLSRMFGWIDQRQKSDCSST